MTYTYKTKGEIPPFSTISHYPYIWSSAVTVLFVCVTTGTPPMKLCSCQTSGRRSHGSCFPSLGRTGHAGRRCCSGWGLNRCAGDAPSTGVEEKGGQGKIELPLLWKLWALNMRKLHGRWDSNNGIGHWKTVLSFV